MHFFSIPVVVAADEGPQDRSDNFAVVEGPKRLADVVQQRHRDVFVVLVVAQRARGGLQAMIVARDVVGGVLAQFA